ncbi:MAG: rubrerythrin family protein [Clostridium sp.]|uniref:rubrerythrin family protein n=1 Tax=Clostridium sp. TaxID=1506 RepID=UPI002FC91265
MNFLGSQTEKNLKKTFTGESKANTKYTLYAEKARQQGYHYIAQVFEQTAYNELAHARKVYGGFLNQVKSTEENLMNSFMGEAAEATKIYKEYEDIARKEGFDDVADFYKEVAEVEAIHDIRFRAIYNKLLNGTLYKGDADSLWQCTNCGYIHEGETAPKICPLCKFPQGWFEPYCTPHK